jgi:hypothetical protein
MDPNVLKGALVEHFWLGVAIIVIGYFVRALRDDNAFPLSLPATVRIPFTSRTIEGKRLKPWIAMGLGLLYGVLEKVAAGTTWKRALTDAAVAGLGPILVHELGIESVRGGTELPLPGTGSASPPNDGSGGTGSTPYRSGDATVALQVEAGPPPPSAKRSSRPIPGSGVNRLCMATAGFALLVIPTFYAGCSADQKHTERVILDRAIDACVELRGSKDPICATANDLELFVPFIQDLIAQEKAALAAGKVGAAARPRVTCTVSP